MPARNSTGSIPHDFRRRPLDRRRREAESLELPDRDVGADLREPLLADPLDPPQVVHRPVGPALDDPPGDHRPDPRQRLQFLLGRRVDVDRAAPVLRDLRRASTFAWATWSSRSGGPRAGAGGGRPPTVLPSLTTVTVPSRSVRSSGISCRASSARVSGWGCPNSLPGPRLATASFGPDQAQPPGVGAVAAAVVGQLQDRAVPDQVRDVRLPERPLPGLAVAGQQDRERPVLDPDADRVVVLVPAVLGRLGQDRQRRPSRARSCGGRPSGRSPACRCPGPASSSLR